MQKLPEQVKLAADGGAIAATTAVLLGYIPHLAAVASLVWAIMRCYSEWLTIKEKRNKKK